MISDLFKKRSELQFPFLIFFLSILLYLPSINIPFFSDELAFITRNEADKVTDIVSLFHKKDYDGDYYRPLPNLASALVTELSGYNSTAYRIFNLLLHSFNSILVFILVLSLPYKHVDKRLTAFFGAVLFSAFPLNDYAVIWYTDLFDRLMTFFYLISLILFLRNETPGVGSLVSFLCASLSKEMAFSLPVVIFFLSFHLNYKNTKKSLKDFLPYFLVLVLLVLFRWAVFDNNVFYLQDAHSGVGILTAIRNLIYFTGMLLFPFNLRSVQESLTLYPIHFYTVGFILITVFIIVIMKFRRTDVLFLILILILLITIIPASRLLMRWYLYLPSGIFCILIAYFIFTSNIIRAKKILFSIIIFGIYYSYSTLKLTDWIEVSKMGEYAITEMKKEFGDKIRTANELVFLTIPAKVKDIPLFQLGFDIHLNSKLNLHKKIDVLSKSYLKEVNDPIGFSASADHLSIYQTGDNYFILYDVEKNVKFNIIDFQGIRLKRLHFIKEKEPYKIYFTFSEGKFHLIKDYNEN